MSRWNDPQNAEFYDRFARTHAMYRNTSRDLVDLAEIDGASFVVDLACGTGVTTEAILARIPADARVVALDGSDAMLAVAKRNVTDERVAWIHAPAVDLAGHTSGADAIVCNSAIWQLDMEATIAAVDRGLAPGGRFAFNIGRWFLIVPFTEEELHPKKASLQLLIQSVAILDYGYVPGPLRRGGRPLTIDGINAMAESVGLKLDEPRTFEYVDSAESELAWVNVPVFADNVLPGMRYEQQVEVHAKAFERYDNTCIEPSRWYAFVARKP